MSEATKRKDAPSSTERERDYQRGMLDGIELAAQYCEATLEGNHPSLAHAYRHAAINIRAFAGTRMAPATTVDGVAASSATTRQPDEGRLRRFAAKCRPSVAHYMRVQERAAMSATLSSGAKEVAEKEAAWLGRLLDEIDGLTTPAGQPDAGRTTADG